MSEERKLTFMGAINEAIDQSMEKMRMSFNWY